MNHFRAKRRLAGLLDGWLTAREEAGVRRHVAACRRCARHLWELRASEQLLRGLPHALAPRVWTPAGEAGLRAAAGLAPSFAVAVEDRMAMRAAVATALVVALFAVVASGPWNARAREPRGPHNLLAAAEREATIAKASFERAWVVN